MDIAELISRLIALAGKKGKKGYIALGISAVLCVAVIVLVMGLGGTEEGDGDEGLSVYSETTTVTTTVRSTKAPKETTSKSDTTTKNTTTTKATTADTAAETTTAAEEYVEYKFRSKKLLDQHYEKHGIDMGFASAEEYEGSASDVVNDPTALHKTEKEDGDDIYYIEATNEFVVVSTDGYLRTYFYPDKGKAYYDKQ